MTGGMPYRFIRFWGSALMIAGVVAWSCGPGAGRTWALVGDSEGAFGLDGSLRTVGGVIDNYDFEPFFGRDNEIDETVQTILRMTALGRPRDSVAYEIHLVQSLTYFSGSTAPQGTAFDLATVRTRYRALDDTVDWLTEDRTTASLWLDRFNFKIALPATDITVGRQAITFGKAFFWNPLDVFLPFDPRQFDRDYKAGVDALRVDIALGNFSGITLVGVLGRELDLSGDYIEDEKIFNSSWFGSSLMTRVFTNFSGWDFAVQGGKVYGGYQIGGGLTGEISALAVRGEAAYFWADNSPDLPLPLHGDLIEDQLTAVVGVGHRFENSLMLDLEYFYNEGGEDDDFNTAQIRFRNRSILNLGRQLVGFRASYEFLPILVGDVSLIYSLSDSSAQIQPLLNLSLSDNAEFLLGVSLNFGARPGGESIETAELKSEFGTNPHFYFMEVKFYF